MPASALRSFYARLFELVVAQRIVLGAAGGRPLVEGDADPLDAVSLALQDVEAHAVPRDVVTRLGGPTALPADRAADRVEALVGERRAEAVVELVDREHAADAVRVVVDLLDLHLGDVELVLDLADDLLDQILERQDPRHRAVLVDDDREVRARAAKVGQE